MVFKCKGCTERHIGCHSTCESYLSIKKINDAGKAQRVKEADITSHACENSIKIRNSMRRNNRRSW